MNNKPKIYIDLSNLLAINFTTGIQRVVIKVVTRLVKKENIDIVLLSYMQSKQCWNIIDNEAFYAFYNDKTGTKNACFTPRYLNFDELDAGSIFFDIDAVWSSRLTRSYLYPILKNCGIKIITMVYDIIPLTHPQFSQKDTVMRFTTYFGAILKYCDKIITNTNATVEQIEKLCEKIGEKCPPCEVMPLGSDFKNKETENIEITWHLNDDGEKVPDDEFKHLFPNPDVSEIINAGKYILMVGTIEPRKNHKLVLDALDNGLEANVVFAGRIGWNIKDFVEEVKNHPLYEKRLFLITNANDAAINELYKNAYYLAFPTFNEGFGLPIIESFEKGTPVVASDIGVLREVGKDFADYIDNTDPKAFADFVNKSLKNPKEYEKKKANLKNFVPYTWNEAADDVYNILNRESQRNGTVKAKIKQMVVLTARHEDIMRSLPYVEKYMPFIEELIVCCPDWNVEPFKENYKGNLKLTFRTDDQLLNGRPLPKDHVARNFLLRCLMMRLDCLDDVFIMSDDDYRPLFPITEDVFIENGRYVGYYFYDMKKWQGSYGHYTSFDEGAFRTREFLMSNGYPTRQYSSHQPQVIDKNIFNEMVETHKGMENMGYEEWCVYFNYGIKNHPDKFVSRPYVTLGWPGNLSDWNLYIHPDNYLFENFYQDLYEKGKIFDGFSTTLNENTPAESRAKVKIFNQAVKQQFNERAVFDSYCRTYNNIGGGFPSLIAYKDEKTKKLSLHLPKFIQFACDCWTRVPITITDDIFKAVGDNELYIGYHFFNSRELAVISSPETKVEKGDNHIMLPVRSPKTRLEKSAMIFYFRIRKPKTEEMEEEGVDGELVKEVIRRIPAVIS